MGDEHWDPLVWRTLDHCFGTEKKERSAAPYHWREWAEQLLRHAHHFKIERVDWTNENRHNLVTTIRNGGLDSSLERESPAVRLFRYPARALASPLVI